jgi:hypothetical protein
LIDFVQPIVSNFGVIVVLQQARHRPGAFDDQIGVFVEKLEKLPLARHQCGQEAHGQSPYKLGFSYRQRMLAGANYDGTRPFAIGYLR